MFIKSKDGLINLQHVSSISCTKNAYRDTYEVTAWEAGQSDGYSLLFEGGEAECKKYMARLEVQLDICGQWVVM